MIGSLLQRTVLAWALTLLLGGAGCSGTNTGNALPNCPRESACSDPVNVTGPDGITYRGRVFPDTFVLSDPNAASEVNPPVAKLTFGGAMVDLTGGVCQENTQSTPYEVDIFVGANDDWLDAGGTLHAHVEPRTGYFASGPIRCPYTTCLNDATTQGWSVDLTLTAAGHLTATLMHVGAIVSGGAAGGGGGGAGAIAGGNGGANDAGDGGSAPVAAPIPSNQAYTIVVSGPVASFCGERIPVSPGGKFVWPCREQTGCDVSGG